MLLFSFTLASFSWWCCIQEWVCFNFNLRHRKRVVFWEVSEVDATARVEGWMCLPLTWTCWAWCSMCFCISHTQRICQALPLAWYKTIQPYLLGWCVNFELSAAEWREMVLGLNASIPVVEISPKSMLLWIHSFFFLHSCGAHQARTFLLLI